MRPCGVSGKPWQLNRASNSLWCLSTTARTQLFPTFAASQRPLSEARSSPSPRYENLSKFQGHCAHSTTSKADHHSKPITLQSRSIPVINQQSFLTNEAVIFTRKVKLYVEMHIWGNFKESLALIQSRSSLPLSLFPSSFFHFIYTSHTFPPPCHWSFSLN